jgi:hypothetical protein
MPVYTCDFGCDFLFLTDVNDWIIGEYAECVIPHLNIRNWFTRSHPSKGEIREIASVKTSFCCAFIYAISFYNGW